MGFGIAVVGLVAGLVLGITSYQNSQQEIDTFARVAVPGTVTMQVDEPGQQVVYYECGENAGLDDLVVSIVDPIGSNVAVTPYEGELIYETTDLIQGRALASFDATQSGAYEIEVSGIDTGQVTGGESFSRLQPRVEPGGLPGRIPRLANRGKRNDRVESDARFRCARPVDQARSLESPTAAPAFLVQRQHRPGSPAQSTSLSRDGRRDRATARWNC